jgi:hypothetical protein
MNEAVILLDTNVVSELMRSKPAQPVSDCFAAQDSTRLFFSAVSEAELRTGAAPRYHRRHDHRGFRGPRTAPQRRRAAGQPITEADCQIAAIARVRSRFFSIRFYFCILSNGILSR